MGKVLELKINLYGGRTSIFLSQRKGVSSMLTPNTVQVRDGDNQLDSYCRSI